MLSVSHSYPAVSYRKYLEEGGDLRGAVLLHAGRDLPAAQDSGLCHRHLGLLGLRSVRLQETIEFIQLCKLFQAEKVFFYFVLA